MYLTDYHLHSAYSFDGHSSLTEICEQAIKKGLNEIAITDHMDIYSDKPYTDILNCSSLFSDLSNCIEQYKNCLIIRTGIEYGQPMVNPAEAQRFLKDYPNLDFIIGSVHNMENDIDVGDYDFQKEDPYAVYNHYLDYLITFATDYDYDVIGHITYPLRYFAQAGISFDISGFKNKICHLYHIIIARGKGIELNVSGLRQPLHNTMPDAELLQLYHECGGQILTIGSDAHFPNDVGAGILQGQKTAKKCGFRKLSVFCQRKPHFISF